jgi:hypothetical protein
MRQIPKNHQRLLAGRYVSSIQDSMLSDEIDFKKLTTIKYLNSLLHSGMTPVYGI